jgi:cell division septal protein FtsQ
VREVLQLFQTIFWKRLNKRRSTFVRQIVMARQAATVKRTTKRRTPVTRGVRQTTSRKKTNRNQFATFFVPLIFILCLAFCIFYLLFLGYQEVAKSSFFDLRESEIYVLGIAKNSDAEIKEIVKRKTLDGVWNANLSDIQNDVEKLEFVKPKSVVVSRILPNGVRVRLEEKLP